MTTAQLEYIAFICFMAVLALMLTVGLDRVFRRLDSGPDVGVDIVDCGMVADVDEDIKQPRVEVIDDALRQVGADNRGAQDWLLDRRLVEMQRRAAS